MLSPPQHCNQSSNVFSIQQSSSFTAVIQIVQFMDLTLPLPFSPFSAVFLGFYVSSRQFGIATMNSTNAFRFVHLLNEETSGQWWTKGMFSWFSLTSICAIKRLDYLRGQWTNIEMLRSTSKWKRFIKVSSSWFDDTFHFSCVGDWLIKAIITVCVYLFALCIHSYETSQMSVPGMQQLNGTRWDFCLPPCRTENGNISNSNNEKEKLCERNFCICSRKILLWKGWEKLTKGN